MLNTFRSRWIVETALGYLLGFWSFGLIHTIFSFFKPESIAHIGPLDLPEHLDRNARLGAGSVSCSSVHLVITCGNGFQNGCFYEFIKPIGHDIERKHPDH